MNARTLGCASLLLLTLAACQREQAAPETVATPAPASPAPATPAPAPAAEPAQAPIDAVEVIPMPAAAGAFDKRTFAGTFGAGGTTLELGPDGGYVLTDAGATMDGTWSTESGDTHVRLDPNSKAEADRLFAIADRDTLSPLTPDGKPAGDAPTLKRGTP